MTLPTFLIIGERRCGTTTLYHWLNTHPDVYMYPETDTSYFIDSAVTGGTWVDVKVDYTQWDATHSCEEYEARFAPDKTYYAIGEKSADILFWQPSHERLARYLPEARFIILLRNPIDRAWSHYWNDFGKGRETLSFARALEQETQRASTNDYARYHASYRERGFYDQSLNRFFQVVHPERALVLISEEVFADPQYGIKQISEFIGIDAAIWNLPSVVNRAFNRNWTMIKRDWVQSLHFEPIMMRYEATIKRIIARFTRGKANRTELNRRYLKYALIPFRKSADKLSLNSSLRDHLMEVYNPMIENLETQLGRNLDIWKE